MLFRSIALMLGAACTPLPTPFAHEPEDITKTRRQMLELPDAAGIFVNPEIAGASAEQSAALTAALVKALGDMNVPATTTNRGRQSYTLEGKLASAASGTASGKVLILWRLVTPEGEQIGEHLQNETVAPREWQAASKNLMTRIAGAAAKPLAAFIQDKGGEAAQFAISANVEVRAVEGAPGTPFDPRVHEAIANVPTAAHPEGAIVDEVRRGYLLRDRVIRPALVAVASGEPKND